MYGDYNPGGGAARARTQAQIDKEVNDARARVYANMMNQGKPAPTLPTVDEIISRRTGPATSRSQPSGIETSTQRAARLAAEEAAKGNTGKPSTTTTRATSTGGGGGGGGGGSTPTQGQQTNKLLTAQELADMFGFTFGQDEIEAILNQATTAKFDEMDAQTRKLRDQGLTDYSSAYEQYALRNRENQARALKSGLSRGANIAQEVLGQVQSQAAGGMQQQQYQQQLADMVKQRGSQLASDKFTAMNTQNELATNLGTMSVNQYGNEVQEDAAYMSYLGQIAQAEAQRAMASAQRYSADQTSAYMNNQSSAAAQQSSTLINNLVNSGRLDSYYANLVGYGLMDVESAEAAYQAAKRTQQPQQPRNYPHI